MSCNIKCHTYTIDFDSALGQSVKNYIERCNQANEAADAFARDLHKSFRFPELTSDDTLCFSDDCDAGGLLYISISNERLSSLQSPDYVMWASLEDPNDDSRTIWFPRIEVQSRYIRFGEAVKLFRKKSKNWEFRTKASDPSAIKSFNYGDVARTIAPGNLRALADKRGNPPSHATRLALGRYYYLSNDEGGGAFQADDTHFAKALELYKAWNELPRVHANALAGILHLEVPEYINTLPRDGQSIAGYLSDISFCRWRVDNNRRCYVIQTGLVSNLRDMHLADDNA